MTPPAARLARWAALVLAIFLILFLRSPDVLLLPPLEAEDGIFHFTHFYARRGAGELLFRKSGYAPLLANAIAYASVRLPTRAIPYGFAWLPLLLALTAYAWLFAAPYRRWVGSDATRATVCLLFALAPVAQWHLFANTIYSIWNALLLFTFLILAPWPRTPWRRGAVWAAANVLAWSHPLTVLLAPAIAYRAARERGNRVLHLLTLANLVLYQTIGVGRSGTFSGLTALESLAKLARAAGWTVVVLAQTAFRTAFGSPAFLWVESRFPAAIAAWSIAVAIAAGLAVRGDPGRRVVFGLLLALAAAFTFFSVLGRGVTIVMPIDRAVRYVYLPSLGFLVLYVMLLDRFLVSGRGDPADPGSGSVRRRRRLVLGGLLAWYVLLNAQLGHPFFTTTRAARPPGAPVSAYVAAHPDNGRIVRDFFAALARLEREKGSREGILLVAPKVYDWPITLDTRPGSRPR